MTHNDKVLQLLSDRKPHTHMEGYRLGVMLHSRVADLRNRGHVIECWREFDNYLYRLVSSPDPRVGDGVAASTAADPPVTPFPGGSAQQLDLFGSVRDAA